MGVIFLFVDGIGLGKDDETNPFSGNSYKAFEWMCDDAPFTEKAPKIYRDNHLFKGVDATLGLKGLPQSGTGQTALFTGINAAEVIGRHFGPFPHSSIKYLLREQSLFNKIQRVGKSVRFINGYPEIFFKKAQKRNRWSCTTVMTKSAGLPLLRAEDVIKERALTAGLTQQAWRKKLNIDVPVISPEQAADRLLRESAETDLILSEYYLTDKAGHAKDFENVKMVLSVYDRFLQRLIDKKDEKATLVLCSDHGNLEDLSTKTHTRNNVPLFVYGPGTTAFKDARSILDVTPAIVDVLSEL